MKSEETKFGGRRESQSNTPGVGFGAARLHRFPFDSSLFIYLLDSSLFVLHSSLSMSFLLFDFVTSHTPENTNITAIACDHFNTPIPAITLTPTLTTGCT